MLYGIRYNRNTQNMFTTDYRSHYTPPKKAGHSYYNLITSLSFKNLNSTSHSLFSFSFTSTPPFYFYKKAKLRSTLQLPTIFLLDSPTKVSLVLLSKITLSTPSLQWSHPRSPGAQEPHFHCRWSWWVPPSVSQSAILAVLVFLPLHHLFFLSYQSSKIQ